ncbi:MAG: PAS domain S-box protein [Desulfobacterales bacterium]|nr:PAS domain S-box protein [Desulfobacterales bacterium]
MAMKPDKSAALKIALIYAIFAGNWVLFSDQILAALISDPKIMTQVQSMKGASFVILTAWLVFYLFHRELARLDQVRSQLHQSEEKYRVVVENSPDLMYRTDLEGRIVFVSKSVKEVSGYSVQEAIGMKMAQEIYENPKERDKFLGLLQREGMVKNFEARLKKKDGTIWWASTNAHFYKDDEGNVIGVEGVTRDVTEKKKAERGLLEREQHMRAIFEASPDAMVLYDLNGHPLYLNPAFTQVFGWTFEELKGRRIPFVPKNEETITINKIKEIFNKGEPLSFETKRITKDNKILDIILSAAVVKDEDNKAYGMVVNITDISEKRMLEAQYEQAQKMESLGTLAGGIAHDFNNYLTGILGYMDLARKHSKTEKVQRFLEKALASSDRAKSLTHQLLTFSKGGAPVKETAPLERFLKETVGFALSGANVTCEFQIPGDLWTCEYDKNQIGQVIDNIVINAHHAMPDGGNIHLSAENMDKNLPPDTGLNPGKYVKISIQDSGTGIPAKYLNRVFDPFFSTKQSGSGLGLATSYSIVNRHGGVITVSSEPGQGSLFNVYLPSTGQVGEDKEEYDESSYTGSGTILIMDDEAMVRDMLGGMLEGMGFDVLKTSKGEDALAVFSKMQTDENSLRAIILDLTVPGGMGGKETIQKIREKNSEIPVFVASGYSDDDALASPESFGFTASLEKPFLGRNLGDMLRRHL